MSNAAALSFMKELKESMISVPFRPRASNVVEAIDAYLDGQKGEPMETKEEPKKTGLEILKELPLIDRIAFVVNTLTRLENQNRAAAGGVIAATRAQADAKMIAKGKAQSYHDTTVFLIQVFGDELREKLAPVEEKGGIIL